MADYLSPDVRVQQIPANPTATLVDIDLYPTVVGPCYRVVKEKTIHPDGAISAPITTSYPTLDPGAIVDTASVVVKIKNAVWSRFGRPSDLTPGVNIPEIVQDSLVAGKDYYYHPGIHFLNNVSVGDKFAIGTALAPDYYLVVKTVTDHMLTFETVSNTTVLSPNFKILQHISNALLSDDNYIASAQHVVISSTGSFISGEITLSYRALRKDILGLNTFNNLLELEAVMEVDPQNKLGFNIGLGGFVANGGNRPIIAYIIASESTEDFLAALAELSITSKTYFLIPTSNNPVVVNAFDAHATTESEWEVSQFRVSMNNSDLTVENVLVSSLPHSNQA